MSSNATPSPQGVNEGATKAPYEGSTDTYEEQQSPDGTTMGDDDLFGEGDGDIEGFPDGEEEDGAVGGFQERGRELSPGVGRDGGSPPSGTPGHGSVSSQHSASGYIPSSPTNTQPRGVVSPVLSQGRSHGDSPGVTTQAAFGDEPRESRYRGAVSGIPSLHGDLYQGALSMAPQAPRTGSSLFNHVAAPTMAMRLTPPPPNDELEDEDEEYSMFVPEERVSEERVNKHDKDSRKMTRKSLSMTRNSVGRNNSPSSENFRRGNNSMHLGPSSAIPRYRNPTKISKTRTRRDGKLTKARNGCVQGLDNETNRLMFELRWDRGMEFSKIAAIFNRQKVFREHERSRETIWGGPNINNRYNHHSAFFFKQRGLPRVMHKEAKAFDKKKIVMDKHWRGLLRATVSEYSTYDLLGDALPHFMAANDRAMRDGTSGDFGEFAENFENSNKWKYIRKKWDEKCRERDMDFGMTADDLKCMYARILNDDWIDNPIHNKGRYKHPDDVYNDDSDEGDDKQDDDEDMDSMDEAVRAYRQTPNSRGGRRTHRDMDLEAMHGSPRTHRQNPTSRRVRGTHGDMDVESTDDDVETYPQTSAYGGVRANHRGREQQRYHEPETPRSFQRPRSQLRGNESQTYGTSPRVGEYRERLEPTRGDYPRGGEQRRGRREELMRDEEEEEVEDEEVEVPSDDDLPEHPAGSAYVEHYEHDDYAAWRGDSD